MSGVIVDTGVAPVTGAVTPAITEFKIVAALTVITYVASPDPIVAVYVPTPLPASNESAKFPVAPLSVTVCGEPLVMVAAEIAVLVSATSVHVPSLTVMDVVGADPPPPDRVRVMPDVVVDDV